MEFKVDFQLYSTTSQQKEGLEVYDWLREELNVPSIDLNMIPRSLYVRTWVGKTLTVEQARATGRHRNQNSVRVVVKTSEPIPFSWLTPAEPGISISQDRIRIGNDYELNINPDILYGEWVCQGYPETLTLQFATQTPEDILQEAEEEEYVEP